jgi:predicted type IV restriction endonuclease
MAVSKRFEDRARPALRRFQKVLESARKRDVNESDTSVIVSDLLTEILGYDKYQEVTTELSVRSTFCDLAIKLHGRLQYLIEVKSIGTELKDTHLRQAIEYGSREGIEWVLLTNGYIWQAHRIRFEQPIDHDLVFEVNLLSDEAPTSEVLEKLYLVSKEAGNASVIDLYWQSKEATSRYVLAQLLLSESVLHVIRRHLRSLFKGTKITAEELSNILQSEVLKRDVLEGDKALAAAKTVRRAVRRRRRALRAVEAENEPVQPQTKKTATTPTAASLSSRPDSTNTTS